MDIVTVIGTVVSTQKVAKLKGYKLLLVGEPDPSRDGAPACPGIGDSFGATVALDTVGAGVGERVIVVRGSSARVAAGLADTPVDAVIVGIVDQIDRDGRTVYRKADG